MVAANLKHGSKYQMVDIRDHLAQIAEADQERFLRARMLMRRTYLLVMQGTVGLANYREEDDTFMDALDIKTEMLMHRAGIETRDNANRIAEDNASDPFALITRPITYTQKKLELSDEQEKQVDEKLAQTDKVNGNGKKGGWE